MAYKASPNRASEVRIERASSGPLRSQDVQVEMVMDYIATAARESHGGDIQAVPCPSFGDWALLSSRGRRSQLPSTTQLALYCGRLRKPREDLHVSVFEEARGRLLAAVAKS